MLHRFNAAVKQCKHGDEDDIWVKLQQCHLRDSKARQVITAAILQWVLKSVLLLMPDGLHKVEARQAGQRQLT